MSDKKTYYPNSNQEDSLQRWDSSGSYIASKSIVGFMDTGSHGVDRNFHTQTVAEYAFDAVRIGLFNLHTADTTGVACAIGVSSNPGADGSASTNTPDVWVDAKFAGADTVTLPLGAAGRPTLTWTDWMGINSLPRTDGGRFPVVHNRIFVPSANATATKFSASGLFAWMRDELKANGRLLRVMDQDGGDYVNGTKTSFTDVVDAFRWYPHIIQYSARGKVKTLFVISDSFGAGLGATNYSEGFIWRARNLVSTPECPVEICNLGWSGQGIVAITNRALDLINNGAIKAGDAIFITGFSPNDYSPTITAAGINTARTAIAGVLRAASNAGVRVAIQNGPPTNPAVKAFAATDSLRVAWNADVALRPGTVIMDVATGLEGVRDSSGQINFTVGLTSDNIHPSDAGHQALVPETERVLRALLSVNP